MNDRRKIMEHPPFPLLDAAEYERIYRRRSPSSYRDLRWTLRDIKAKRTMFPVNPDHLRTLIELGLVEMRDDVPAITNAGHQILD